VAKVHHDSKLHKVTIASDTNVIKLQNDFWLIYRCFKKVFSLEKLISCLSSFNV